MGIYDKARAAVQNFIFGGLQDDERETAIELRRAYRKGIQKKQIEVRHGSDDNITINFVGLVVDRAVTMLFGKGIEFDLPGEGETTQSEYITEVWDANKQEILLHKIGTLGAESGTCYLKILPDGITGKNGKLYPRLVPQDPKMVTIITNPDDIEYVMAYVIQWDGVKDGKEVQRKQEIRRVTTDTEGEITSKWETEDYWRKKNSANWQSMGKKPWDFDFPPMIHWQNMPDALSPYGIPDITEDVIILQDRLNFVASNMSKIIRLHAHPTTIFKGIVASDVKTNPGQAVFLPTEGDAFNLEMNSDLQSSFNFLQFMRQALFSITQSVDVSSFADKIGALTNFGLRVLYMDALARLQTKQELYGDALSELNRRLLVLNGIGDDGGTVIWPEILPESETEETAALEADLRMGIVSKQTVAQQRGYDWEEEQKRIAEQQTSEDNVGAAIIRAFNRGA